MNGNEMPERRRKCRGSAQIE